MADLAAGIFDGGAGAEAIVTNWTASTAIEIGAPVIQTAIGTGEIFPRVTTATDGTLLTWIGVCVGGDANGIWVDGTTTNDGSAAAAAGETVKVCTKGRCKIRVDGSTGGANSNIALGDALSGGAANVAQRAQTGDFILGRALQASTASTDAILMEVTMEGLDATT